MFHNYDPFRIAMSFRGIPLLAPQEGTFLVAERMEDAYSMAVGSTGDVTRVRSRNRTGSLTVTLQQSSPTNDQLSAIAALDERSNLGYGEFFAKDMNGTTIVQAPVAWIRKVANVEYGDEALPREWVFDCAELFMLVGGALA